MAFNVPIQNPLTQAQEQTLAKLGSLNALLTNPFKSFSTLGKSKQISLLDYATKISDATLGSGYIDLLIFKFLNELFDKNSIKLEKIIIKSLAASFDAQGVTISLGQKNKDWLEANVQDELHIAFQILKALMVKKIACMIFGPKENMKVSSIPPGTYNNTYLPDSGNFDDLDPNELLDNSALSDVMFTTVNTESNTFGDSEANIVKLRQQLEKGQVTFTISCQDVKINLPPSVIAEMDDNITNNIQSFLGQTIPGQTVTYQNPANGFVTLTGHINNETQAINNEENVNAVKKSWLRILLDKTINLLPLVLLPFIRKVCDKVNQNIQSQTGNNSPILSAELIIGLAVGLKNIHSDESLFKKNSTFYTVIMNSIYAMVLGIILKKLIKEITKIITKALAKKRARDLQTKYKRLQARAKILQDQSRQVENKILSAKALETLKPIFNYNG